MIRRMQLHWYVVRHGQTRFNRYNRLQGWSDSPLTKQGIADAMKAAHKLDHLQFAAAFCSDTGRATRTAERILDVNEQAGHTRPSLVRDLHFREQFYGYFEGQDMAMSWYAAGAPYGAPTFNDIVEKYGAAATKDFLKEADPFHDAESNDEYWARIEGIFPLIEHTPGLHDGDNILMISHGNTLLSLMRRFAPTGFDLSQRPANGSVTVFDIDTDKPLDEGHVVVASYNQ